MQLYMLLFIEAFLDTINKKKTDDNQTLILFVIKWK